MPRIVHRDVASRHGFTWLLSLLTWGRCGQASLPLHRPTACSHQTMREGLLLGVILSHHCSGRWRLSGDLKPPRLGYLV
jgi:hypothetical protein